MSSIGLTLNNAMSGLTAGQAALSVASQNVANVNTEGFTRKIANQSNRVVDGLPNGVQVETVTRITHEFLNNEFRRTTSEAGRTQALTEFFERMQTLFGSPGSNTSFADDFTNLMTALEALSNNPESAGLRFDVVAAAQIVADNISRTANDIQALRLDVDREIKAAVDRINVDLVEIDSLNADIKRIEAVGGSAADLEDQRDLLIRQVASEIELDTFRKSDGRLALLTSGGKTLVDAQAHQIDYTPVATVTANTVFSEMRIFAQNFDGTITGAGDLLVSSGTSPNVTTALSAGRLAGLLQIRDRELVDFAATLDSLANTIRDEINAVHNLGAGFPPPNTLSGTRSINAGDAFQGTGTVRLAVTDASGTMVDVHDLDLTALGATTINGLLTNINTALAGNATASIVNGTLQIAADDPANGIAINPAGTAEATTNQSFSHFFGFNDLFEGTGSASFAVRSIILNDPSRVATGELSTSAAVGDVAISPGDNRIVQRLAAIGETQFAFSAVGGIPAINSTINDFAGSIIGLNAARSSAATDAHTQREFQLENIEHRYTSTTGVNLDEELANMVLFQNAFAMSARVFSVASEMLDTLVNMRA